MRVTVQTKDRTRKRIVACAKRLFDKKGFEAATTRDIASAAGIANGTLFNYFANKETLALSILDEALIAAEAEFAASVRGGEPLEELLFAHVAVALRHLRPFRKYVVPVFESTLSPLMTSAVCPEAEVIRLRHLETVRHLISRPRAPEATDPSLVTLHLYWALFLGVLGFWASDFSRNGEDSLALLDRSMRVFAATLPGSSSKTGVFS